MGVATNAKLYGNVNESAIAEFIKQKYGVDAKIDVNTDIHPKDMYESYIDTIKEWYDPDKRYFTRSGFIHFRLNGEPRSLFYCYHSVNFYENLEYYAEKGLEKMVKTETTYVSLGHNEEAVEVIKAIAMRFGGWYCENDCDSNYEETDVVEGYENLTRIDIMTDIETLGKGENPPVFQIAACAFDINTGNIIEKFNVTADISKMNNIEGDTLIWWLNTNKELLLELLTKGKESKNTERDIVFQFCNWVHMLARKYNIENKKVFLWGNGILFDNRIIKHKCDVYNLEYPIYYRSDRDMRTILELASIKMGYDDDMEYKNTVENVGVAHDAFDDVLFQIKVLTKSFKDLMREGDEIVE